MVQKEHHIIISLASNFNQEANLEAARTQLTQLLTEAHFTSAKWTEPIGNGPLGSAAWHRQECSKFRLASPRMFKDYRESPGRRWGCLAPRGYPRCLRC